MTKKRRLRNVKWADNHGYTEITAIYTMPREETMFVDAVVQFDGCDICLVVVGTDPLQLQIWRKERECNFGPIKDENVWMEE